MGFKYCYILLVMLLSGCLATSQLKSERNKIFSVYDKSISITIILAYEKIYGDTFDIAKNYLQYSKETDNPTYDGFYVWLIKNLWYPHIFEEGDGFGIGQWLIDNRFNDNMYQEAKKNYELLEKMQNAKD